MAGWVKVKLGVKRDPVTRRYRTWWGWRRVLSVGERVVSVARLELGTLEQPRDSNSGARVREYQASTTVGGTGWPWCVAFTVWARKQCGAWQVGEYSGGYVPHLEFWARKAGRWRKSSVTPKPGWRVIFDWAGDGAGDHVGFVLRVVSRLWLRTIEGNTQPGAEGDQSNGGGVWERLRRRNHTIRGYVA